MSGQDEPVELPVEVETDLAFAIVPEWVLVSRVSAGAKILYSVLALHADRRRGVAWPSIDRLAAIAGSSRSGVQRALRELERFGAISRQARFAASRHAPRQTSNLYTVHRMPPSTRGVTGDTPKERPANGGGVSPMTPPPVSPVTPHEPESEGTRESASHSTAAPEARTVASEASPRTPSLHHRLIDLWSKGYLEHRGAKYIFQPTRDGPAVKRLIASGATEDDFASRMTRGFESEFWAPKLGTLAAFCGSAWNHLAPTPAEIEAKEAEARRLARKREEKAATIVGRIQAAEDGRYVEEDRLPGESNEELIARYRAMLATLAPSKLGAV